MADTYTFESLLNTTDGMTAIINNKKQDDNTVSVTGVDWRSARSSTEATRPIRSTRWIKFRKRSRS